MIKYTIEVYNDGCEIWRNKDGRMHRENGPAFMWPNGTGEYWINGEELTKEEFESRSKPKHEGQVVVVDGVECELKAKGE